MTENDGRAKVCMGCHQPIKGGRVRLATVLSVVLGVITLSMATLLFIFHFEPGGGRTSSRSDEFLFINQWNNQSWINISVTEDHIYLADTRDIIVYSHDFEVEDTLEIDNWLDEIYVHDGVIYYVTFGSLYRYDPEERSVQAITEEVHNMVRVDHLIFYQSEWFGASNLYVYDLERGRSDVLIREDIREFMVNPASDRIVFLTDEGSLYYVNMLGEEQTSISSQRFVWTFGYDGEYVIWEDFNSLYRFDFETEQTIVIGEAFDMRQMAFIADYVVFTDWSNDLHVMNSDGGDHQIIASNARNFAVTSDQIVFDRERSRSDLGRYVVNLEGTITELTENGLGDVLIPERDGDAPREPHVTQNDVPLEQLSLEIVGDLTFANQANANARFSDPVFLTEDGAYFVLRDSSWRMNVVRFDLDFKHYDILMTESGRIDSLHVEENALYFTTDGILYRYDVEENVRTTLAEGIYHPIQTNGQIYHQTERFGQGGLYVLDVETGDIDRVISDDVRTFFIDVENDRIIFIHAGRPYVTNLEGRDRQRIADDWIWTFTYDGESVYWVADFEEETFRFNFETDEIESFSAFIESEQMATMENHLVMVDFDQNLYLIDLEGGNQRLLASNVWSFSVVGNLIVYENDDFETRIMDLDGNSAGIEDFLLD